MMNIAKTTWTLIVLAIILNFSVFAAPTTKGEGYILMDSGNGQVLHSENSDKKLDPAETTKILTSILALEKGNLEDLVTISKNVPLVQGTKVYLRQGEEVTLEALINAAMLHSANDAALAIAEHISGSQEKFVALMNSKARELGAKNSNFVNPHGLPDSSHVTTPYDLAVIGQYAMKNPQFRSIVSKEAYDWEGMEWQSKLTNKNELLVKSENSTGIKRGYSSVAGHSVVASAKKGNQEVIAVILGAKEEQLLQDAQELLDYGLADFQVLTITEEEGIVATLIFGENQQVNLIPARASTTNIPIDEQANVEKRVILNKVKLPIMEGEVLGELVIILNGEEIDRIPVKATKEVKKPINWLIILINSLAALFVLQIFAKITRGLSKKKRKRRPSAVSKKL